MAGWSALTRLVYAKLSAAGALIVVTVLFSHYAIGDAWTAGGACYSHPLLVQTCHASSPPSQPNVTLVFERRTPARSTLAR
jgi:hypothetical protein